MMARAIADPGNYRSPGPEARCCRRSARPKVRAPRGIGSQKQATVVYGAPPLLSEKAGETDAMLTFRLGACNPWHRRPRGSRRSARMQTACWSPAFPGPSSASAASSTAETPKRASSFGAVTPFQPAAKRATRPGHRTTMLGKLAAAPPGSRAPTTPS
jgi:hypothetical protein